MHQHPIRPFWKGDGVDDDIAVADHASIQNVFGGGGAVGLWFRMNGAGDANPALVAKTDGATLGWYSFISDATSTTGSPAFVQFFSTTNGIWAANTTINYAIPGWNRLWVSYDYDDVANDPVFYLNGAVVTTIEIQAPVGSAVSDASQGLSIGSLVASSGVQCFKGLLGDVCIKSSGTLSSSDAEDDWRENSLADSAFAARYKLTEDDFPTDNAANSGSGGAGAGSVTGAITEHALARFG